MFLVRWRIARAAARVRGGEAGREATGKEQLPQAAHLIGI